MKHTLMLPTYLLLEVGLFMTYVQGQILSLQGSNSSSVGDEVEFTCTVSGGGPLHGPLYFKKGTPSYSVCTVDTANCSQLSNSTSYSCGCVSGGTEDYYISIISVQREDKADNWMCQYGNSSSKLVQLEVYFPPTITSVPSEMDVTENTSPDIDCSTGIVDGNPPDTSYTWVGPGEYNKPSPVLDRNITRAEGGHYTCTASNTEGLADTAEVDINVQYPPKITAVPKNFNATEDRLFFIDCSGDIESGNPTPTNYTWDGPGDYSSTGPVLNGLLNRTQGGLYTCTATNTDELSDTATVSITVLYLDPPTVSITPTHVSENASVQLFCNVTSKPTVQMTIRNLDNNTNLVDREMTNSRHYVIERAQCLHNGTFQCLADNTWAFLKDTANSQLNVSCLPRHDFRKTLQSDVYGEISGKAAMIADVIGNPVPRFKWQRSVNGQLQPINANHDVHNTGLRSTLTITITHTSDYGMYVVQADNDLGKIELHYTLHQVSAPMPPEEASFVHTGSTSVTFHWKSSDNGGSEQRFSVDYRSDNTEWSPWKSGLEDPGAGTVMDTEITDLTQNTKYLLQVYATNKYGNSSKITRETTTICNLGGVVDIACDDGVGRGLSIGLGFTLPLIIAAILVLIFWFRDKRNNI